MVYYKRNITQLLNKIMKLIIKWMELQKQKQKIKQTNKHLMQKLEWRGEFSEALEII